MSKAQVLVFETGRLIVRKATENDIDLVLCALDESRSYETCWLGIVAYLFEYTDCVQILTTPNVENTAAISICQAAGAVLKTLLPVTHKTVLD